MNPVKSAAQAVANKAFEIRTLHKAGVVGGLGPAALPVAASALIRGGTTPATAIRVAAVRALPRLYEEMLAQVSQHLTEVLDAQKTVKDFISSLTTAEGPP